MSDFDVVVIGSGGAGVAASVSAVEKNARVLLLSKSSPGEGDTFISGGGIAFPRPEENGVAAYIDDILKSGEGLCRRELVETFARNVSAVFGTYAAGGVKFPLNEAGELDFSVAKPLSGHSANRDFIAPGGGKSLASALKKFIQQHSVQTRSSMTCVGIETEDSEVIGVLALDVLTGEVLRISCSSVILATGSTSWLYYPHTDCVPSSSGTGHGLALQAGARLIEMEQVQFLPFGLAKPESSLGAYVGDPVHAGPAGLLVSIDGKVLAGPGINKMNRAALTRVMSKALDLSSPGTSHLLLDLSKNLETEDGRKFLEGYRKRETYPLLKEHFQFNITDGPVTIPVLPTAHYTIGGILVGPSAETDVVGLYAAGAVSGGLHGANRLGGLGLAESIVFGRIAGESAATHSHMKAKSSGRSGRSVINTQARSKIDEMKSLLGRKHDVRALEVLRSLQDVMWRDVGISRSKESLTRAISKIRELRTTKLSVPLSPRFNLDWVGAIELPTLLNVAESTVLSALAREESRGAHIRLDFDLPLPEAKHTVTQIADENVRVTFQRVDDVRLRC